MLHVYPTCHGKQSAVIDSKTGVFRHADLKQQIKECLEGLLISICYSSSNNIKQISD